MHTAVEAHFLWLGRACPGVPGPQSSSQRPVVLGGLLRRSGVFPMCGQVGWEESLGGGWLPVGAEASGQGWLVASGHVYMGWGRKDALGSSALW